MTCRALALLLAAAASACGTRGISGRVELTGEANHSGVEIELLFGQDVVGTAISDADGSWTIDRRSQGLYVLRAKAPSTVERQLEVDVLVDGTTAAPTLHFTPVGRLHATLHQPSNCHSIQRLCGPWLEYAACAGAAPDGTFTGELVVGTYSLGAVWSDSSVPELTFPDVEVRYNAVTELGDI